MSRDALVVGISNYHYGPLNNLRGVPAEDAEAIAKILETYGQFRVRRLPEYFDPLGNYARQVAQNSEVTVRDLRTAIEQLFYPKGDHLPETALFYFSGHGFRQSWGKRQKGYLATSDVNPEQEQLGFELTWLQEILEDSPIKQQIVWLDCCHSGELLGSSEILNQLAAKSSLIVNESLQEINPNTEEDYSRCLITASRGFELAFQQIDGDHGVLTAAMLRGLDPIQRSDGWVTNITLAESIKQALSQELQCPLFLNHGKPIVLTTAVAQRAGKKSGKDVCPYKGLEYFDLEDADFFFGRTALTDRLIRKISQNNFLAVIGPSGSGKSSVVRAGLLHELKLGQKLSGSDRWQYKYEPFTPGEQPFEKLKQVLGIQEDNLAKVIQKDIHERVVLFIDQFEECFTLCQSQEERQQFFDDLLDAVEQTAGKLHLIIAMRADFLGKCAESLRLASKIRAKESLELVTPMSESELTEAIEEPAKKVELEVEPLLVDRMIEDVEGYPGSLPLLQFTLTELWKTRKEPYINSLTLSAYNTLKGVKGALEKVANEVFQSLSDKQQVVAKRIFLELIQPGQETEDTRRRILKQSLVNEQQSEAILDEVIGKLANARLITTDLVDPENPESAVVLDVVHEALIRHWQQLKEWLKEYRDTMQVERKLEDEAEEWEKLGKPEDPAHLRQGARLTEAEDYLKQYTELGLLSNLAQGFIQVSQQVQERLSREKDEQIQALKRAMAEAEQRRKEAEKNEINALIASSEALFSTGQEFDALLSSLRAARKLQQAIETDIDVQIRVIAALQQAVYGVREYNRLSGHDFVVSCIRFSPDGQIIASVSEDRTVRLWSQQGDQLQIFHHDYGLSNHGDYGNDNVSFSPDGQFVAAASSQSVKLWSIHGEEIATFQGGFYSVCFSPDGQILAMGGVNHRSNLGVHAIVQLWSCNGHSFTLQKRLEPDDNEGVSLGVSKAEFSSDGQIVIAQLKDTILIWRLEGENLQLLNQLEVHSGCFGCSPDSQKIAIATASENEVCEVHLLNRNGILLKILRVQGRSIDSVTFSPDSYIIAVTTTLNDTGCEIHLLNCEDTLLKTLSISSQIVHNPVCKIIFSPDGQTLIYQFADKINFWKWMLESEPQETIKISGQLADINPGQQSFALVNAIETISLWKRGKENSQVFQGFPNLTHVSFSPNGQVIAASGHSNMVKRWHINGTELCPLLTANDQVSSIHFSPDGQMLLTAGFNFDRCPDGGFSRVIQLWKHDGTLLQSFSGRGKGVCFSPDGQFIGMAIATPDSTASSSQYAVELLRCDGSVFREFRTFAAHDRPISCICFSPNGQAIATACDTVAKLWDVEGGILNTLRDQQSYMGRENLVSFSPDGQIIATTSHYTVKLWQIDGTLLQTLNSQRSGVTSISFHPSSHIIATAGSYDGVKLWNLKGTELHTLSHIAANSISFSPDGKLLASCNGYGEVKLWNLDLDDLIQRGCNWMHDYFRTNPNVAEGDRVLFTRI